MWQGTAGRESAPGRGVLPATRRCSPDRLIQPTGGKLPKSEGVLKTSSEPASHIPAVLFLFLKMRICIVILTMMLPAANTALQEEARVMVKTTSGGETRTRTTPESPVSAQPPVRRDNLEIWNKLRRTDPKAAKPFTR